MAYTLKIRNQGVYLHMIVEGDNTAEDVANYLAEGVKKCIEFHCPNVLIEENLKGPNLGIFTVYEIITKICCQAAAAVRRVAYVDVNPESKKEVNQFAETTAVNRGVNVKLFETVHEAENWFRETILLRRTDFWEPQEPSVQRERA